MKKLLLFSCLIIGSFSVNAQLTCAAPTVLTTSGTYVVAPITGDNTVDGCFTDVTDINGDPMHSNWYSYTATADGDVSIVTDGVTYTSISALTGTCAALECYESTGLDGGSELAFSVTSGTTYYILFDSFFDAAGFSFNFDINTCSAPGGINNNTNVTFTSATLNWIAAAGLPFEYEVEYGPSGYTPGEGTLKNAFSNSLNLTDLTASGNYEYYVRSVCSAESKSAWVGPGDITLIKTVPYATSFDNASDLSGLLVNGGWGVTFGLSNTAANAQTPDNYIVFNNSTTAVDNQLFTPAISLTAGQLINTSFYVRTAAGVTNRSLKISVGTSVDMADQVTMYSNTSVLSNPGYTQITTPTYTVPATGIYYIGITDFSPAVATTADITTMRFDTFSVNLGTLGVNDFVSNQFEVFPNPVKNIVSISNSANALVSAVSIIDLNGRIVKNENFNNISNITVNISDLAAGVYMMNITSDKGVATKKIIKN